MKKHLLVLPVLLLAIACGREEVNGLDTLSEAEQEYLRTQGTKICTERITPTFERFKSESSKSFTSSAFQRGKVFTYELKEGETVIKTIDLKVWKQTADALYFIVSDTKASSDYFLRIRKSDNEKMINDFLIQYCSKPALYKTSINDNGPLVVTNEYELPKAPNTEVFKDIYTLSFTKPAFLGTYSLSRTLKVEDSEGDAVGTAKTFQTTAKNSTVKFSENDWRDNDYTQKFCSLSSTDNYRFARERNVEGIRVSDCDSNLPTGWNLDVD